MYRIFIIGCSRSGTTLVQKHLCDHLSLITLPETDFFGIASGGGEMARFLSFVGFPRRRHGLALERLKRDLSAYSVHVEIPKRPINLGAATSKFINALDELALKEDTLGWIEKTPKHFKHVHHIERHVPESRFVHVVRDGPAVVASIVDRARTFPDRFKGQGDPDYAIRHWNKAIKVAARNLGKPNHSVIIYENFCTQVTRSLQQVTEELGLPKNPPKPPRNLLDQNRIHRPEETWKENTKGKIKLAESKFNSIFSSQEQSRILSKIDFKTYQWILAKTLSATPKA